MSAQSDFTSMINDFFDDDPQVAIYHQYSQGVYNVNTSEYLTTQVDTAVRVITLDLTRNSNGLSSKYGTDILAGDKDVYMKPFYLEEIVVDVNTTSDKITVGGILYKVCNSKVLDPTSSSPMLFNFLVRR
jgi:hypothetical protein